MKIHFEHRGEALAPPGVYHRRLASRGMEVFAAILLCWVLGACGYHFIARIPGWIDCFYNAAMILGGMGPVSPVETNSGKWFASLYALFSGVFLIASVGYFLTPVFHRLMHRFHLDSEDS